MMERRKHGAHVANRRRAGTYSSALKAPMTEQNTPHLYMLMRRESRYFRSYAVADDRASALTRSIPRLAIAAVDLQAVFCPQWLRRACYPGVAPEP